MHRIELDFVKRSGVGNLAGLALLAGGIGLLAVTALEAADWAAQRQALDDQRARASGQSRTREARAVPEAQLRPEEARALREAAVVAARLRLPWQRLFDETADAAGEGVALTGLQPDAASRTVRIAGLARDLPAANAFVGRLQAKPGFAQAYLAQHDMQRKDPEAALGFVVLATWREEAR